MWEIQPAAEGSLERLVVTFLVTNELALAGAGWRWLALAGAGWRWIAR